MDSPLDRFARKNWWNTLKNCREIEKMPTHEFLITTIETVQQSCDIFRVFTIFSWHYLTFLPLLTYFQAFLQYLSLHLPIHNTKGNLVLLDENDSFKFQSGKNQISGFSVMSALFPKKKSDSIVIQTISVRFLVENGEKEKVLLFFSLKIRFGFWCIY